MLFYEGHFKLASIKWSQENYKHTQKNLWNLYKTIYNIFLLLLRMTIRPSYEPMFMPFELHIHVIYLKSSNLYILSILMYFEALSYVL